MPVFDRQQRASLDQLAEDFANYKVNRRQFLQRAMAVGLSASAATAFLEACGGSSGGVNTSGTPTKVSSIDVLSVLSDGELDKFNKVNAAFTQKTGIRVNVESSRDLPTILNTRVRGGNPPDVSGVPTQTLWRQYASQGKLLQLDKFLDMSYVQQNYNQFWINYSSVNGHLYCVMPTGNTKATVWYSPKQFAANGYTTPKTWNDLIALSDKIAGQGKYPWSMGVESGAASGWASADWIDVIFLGLNGPDMSDKWVAHQISWTDPSVKQAFQYFGQIAHGKHYINGAPQSILATNFQPASYLPFETPPKAYMYYLGDFTAGFITGQFPNIKPGTDFNFFNFPTLNPQFNNAIIAGTDQLIAFKDNDGTRQYMQYLFTAEAQEIWVKLGGKTSVNKSVPLSAYPDDVARATAQQLINAQVIRTSQDDAMPTPMENAYWRATLTFIQDQSKLDSILSGLESTAKSVYGS